MESESFKSNIFDGTAQFEFNFLPYIHGSKDQFYTPYLFAGFSVFYFNPKAELDGETYELRPLGTEGQFKGDEYYTVQGAFTYGVYFNKEDATTERIAHGGNVVTGIITSSVSNNGFVEASDSVDLFFGGDMGVKWGARIHYASTKDQVSASASPVSSIPISVPISISSTYPLLFLLYFSTEYVLSQYPCY